MEPCALRAGLLRNMLEIDDQDQVISWVAAKAIQSPRPCPETNPCHPTDIPQGAWTAGQPKSARGDPAIASRSDIRSMGCRPGRGTAAQAYDGNRDGIPLPAGFLK